jgi:hypothetical protein
MVQRFRLYVYPAFSVTFHIEAFCPVLKERFMAPDDCCSEPEVSEQRAYFPCPNKPAAPEALHIPPFGHFGGSSETTR